MKVAQTANYNGVGKYDDPELYTRQVNFDINTLFTALQGRLRFGSGTSGGSGENIGGVWLKILTPGTSNTEVATHHTLGSQPMGYLVVWQDKAGSLYANPQGQGINTVWTSGTSYFKSDVGGANFMVFLLERGGQ